MNNSFKSSSLRNKFTFFSNYEKNNLFKLICLCFVGFVTILFVKVAVVIIETIPLYEVTNYYNTRIVPLFAIKSGVDLIKNPWTILTFMFAAPTFIKLATSMLWLYLFGNVIQTLVGRKEIYPLFLISNIIGGLVYIAVYSGFMNNAGFGFFLGADAAILGFGVAAITISPDNKLYLTENLRIPMWILVILYAVLNIYISYSNHDFAALALLGSGAIVGLLYAIALKSGYKIGTNIYNFISKNLGSKKQKLDSFESSISKARIERSQENNDEDEINQILDKINKFGMDKLTSKEKETLVNASKK